MALCMNSYDQQYIDDAREAIETHLCAYREFTTAAGEGSGTRRTEPDPAADTFGPAFFNAMVLVLENYFVHRSQVIEEQDGNPLNEVRVISQSLTGNGGVMEADPAITMNPDTSVLGYRVGDPILVTEEGFNRLAEAFFAELEKKFR